jgi:imidazolonepropionase-like amidohydrolase
MTAERWVLADSAWWGPGGLLGPTAARLDGGRVAELGPAADRLPAGAQVLRLHGTLLPGLIDWHGHAGLVDLRRVRAGGIGTLRDLGWEPGGVAALLRRSRLPGSGLPALRVAGAFLSAPGGYPSDRAWAPPGAVRAVLDEADAAAAVAEQAGLGASVVKVTLHPGAGPVLAPALVEAVVAAAAAHGLGVVAHAEGAGQAELAWRCGVGELAHAPWTERLDDRLLERMAPDMTWVGTFDIHARGARTPALAMAVDNARRFVAAGGVLRYGTDLGNGELPLGVNRREVRAMLDAGLTPEQVLTAMTAPPAPGDPAPLGLVPGGLDLDPDRLAASLAGAVVVEPGS